MIDWTGLANIWLPPSEAVLTQFAEANPEFVVDNINVHFYIQDGDPSISLVINYHLDDEETLEVTEDLEGPWKSMRRTIGALVEEQAEYAPDDGVSEAIGRFAIAVADLRDRIACSTTVEQLTRSPNFEVVLRDEFGFDLGADLIAEMREELTTNDG